MVQPVVICPLDYERRLIRKAVGLHAKIIVCGPGPDAVRAAVEKLAADPPPLVILCGVAGGLVETAVAPRIDRILNRDARSWKVPLLPPGEDKPVALLGLDEPIASVDKKRAAAAAYTAALVDCESHAFAEKCVEHKLRWTVIRGVSDGPTESLPAGVTEWVDGEGKARIGRFLKHIMLEPSALYAALRLRNRSRGAMKAAASRLVELLIHERRTAVDPLITRSRAPNMDVLASAHIPSGAHTAGGGHAKGGAASANNGAPNTVARAQSAPSTDIGGTKKRPHTGNT